jgi:D-serine deaminase-like pyridoxal phosphate-dependent protein
MCIGKVQARPNERSHFKVVSMISTPDLLLDLSKLRANADRMRNTAAHLGAMLRPHVKTGKSIEVTRELIGAGPAAITVSTLREAEFFLDYGIRDQIYAVGIAPNKLERVFALRDRGADLKIILDSVEAARAVADACAGRRQRLPILIEIDSDGHRGGVRSDQAPELAAIAGALGAFADVRGVLTHAGGSYAARSRDELRRYARLERDGAVIAADHLRAAGYEIDIVSVGSTPTALFTEDLSGVTELRAGVYGFFDLVMAGIGVCEVADIALSVLASVIAVQPEKQQVLIDAGWMALSRDRGTASQPIDQGYGLVSDFAGRPYRDLIVESANQEHGVVRVRAGSDACLPELHVGDLVRVLPNHACATAAQHLSYAVWNGATGAIEDRWPRIQGW